VNDKAVHQPGALRYGHSKTNLAGLGRFFSNLVSACANFFQGLFSRKTEASVATSAPIKKPTPVVRGARKTGRGGFFTRNSGRASAYGKIHPAVLAARKARSEDLRTIGAAQPQVQARAQTPTLNIAAVIWGLFSNGGGQPANKNPAKATSAVLGG
jgi:hypothetical protein